MNTFNDFVQKILNSGLEPDKAAALIENFLDYRSLVKAEVKAEKDTADYFRKAYFELWDTVDDLNSENNKLQAKVCKLEKELSALQKPTITINLAKFFAKADEFSKERIQYIKWVRNTGLVLSDGKMPELYVARFVADYFLAYFDYYRMGESLPFRGEKSMKINIDSDEPELVRAVELLLEFNLPEYKVVWE